MVHQPSKRPICYVPQQAYRGYTLVANLNQPNKIFSIVCRNHAVDSASPVPQPPGTERHSRYTSRRYRPRKLPVIDSRRQDGAIVLPCGPLQSWRGRSKIVGKRDGRCADYGGEGISVRVLGAGAGPQDGQRGQTSLSSHSASDPAGLGLRSTTMAHIALFARMNWPALKEPLGFLRDHPPHAPSPAPWRGSRMSGCRRP